MRKQLWYESGNDLFKSGHISHESMPAPAWVIVAWFGYVETHVVHGRIWTRLTGRLWSRSAVAAKPVRRWLIAAIWAMMLHSSIGMLQSAGSIFGTVAIKSSVKYPCDSSRLLSTHTAGN